MWYWDYFPTGGNHHKKPLTKKQLQKIQENYAKADIITKHVQELEAKETEKINEKIENKLDSMFL